jgi:hypothetical protein
LGPPWVTSPATANKPSPALRVAPWPMALSFQISKNHELSIYQI